MCHTFRVLTEDKVLCGNSKMLKRKHLADYAFIGQFIKYIGERYFCRG